MRAEVRTMLKSKIHRATVTDADVNYEGSITLDPVLMEAADILPYEQVHVLDVNNGAAARLVSVGDAVIILTYREMDDEAARSHQPRLVYVDAENRIQHTIGLPEAVTQT